MPTQNENGRAYEYALAVALAEQLSASFESSKPLQKAKDCFELFGLVEQASMSRSAAKAAQFLINHDSRLNNARCAIAIQPDTKGMSGDVRDIIVTNLDSKQEIGISAKHRHHAVKHSRLSARIDFGKKWMTTPCSEVYFEQVTPLFGELKDRKAKGELWSEIPDKREKFYEPLLKAFEDEMRCLFDANSQIVAPALVQYLLGRHDFYKVIKINGSTEVQSFNLNGTLKWGRRVPMPTEIVRINRKQESDTTSIIIFDQGWQISFRIHNASSRVEASLKFDIQIMGLPQQVATSVFEH